jgi:hypothetical protein
VISITLVRDLWEVGVFGWRVTGGDDFLVSWLEVVVKDSNRGGGLESLDGEGGVMEERDEERRLRPGLGLDEGWAR